MIEITSFPYTMRVYDPPTSRSITVLSFENADLGSLVFAKMVSNRVFFLDKETVLYLVSKLAEPDEWKYSIIGAAAKVMRLLKKADWIFDEKSQKLKIFIPKPRINIEIDGVLAGDLYMADRLRLKKI